MSVRLGCRMHGPPTTGLLATHQNQTPAWTTVAAMRRPGEHWTQCLQTPSLQRCRCATGCLQKAAFGHSIPFPPHQAQKSQPCITKVNHRCVHIADPSDIAFAKLGSSCSKQFWPGPSTGLPSMPAAVPWAESRPMLSMCAQGLATRVGGSTSGGRGGQGLHFRESIREHMRISGAVRARHRRAHAMRACAQTCVEECGVAPARSASSPNLIPHASLASMAALTAIDKSPGFVQASLVGPVASSPASTYPPLQVPAGAPLRPATRVCTSPSAAL